MARDVATILGEMRSNPSDIKFSEARRVADEFFGASRTVGSHHIYKMPWANNPRVNLQKDGSKAKRYQVVQLLEAIDHLNAQQAAAAKVAAPQKKPAVKAAAAKTPRKKG